jgi:hypothetical protein
MCCLRRLSRNCAAGRLGCAARKVQVPDFKNKLSEFRPQPDLMSRPSRDFFVDGGKLITFMALTLTAAEESDATKGNSGSYVRALLSLQDLQAGMMLCRTVDNFLTYVSELLSLIFRTKPDTLKSGQNVRFDFILQFQTLSDLISALVDKRVSELSYSGMEALSKDLSEHLGFELFPEPEDYKRARYLIEVRNILVHNRGIINRLFLDRLKDLHEPLGEPGAVLQLTYQTALLGLLFLRDAVVDIDSRAAQKFALAREPIPQPQEFPNINSLIDAALHASGRAPAK